MHVEWLDITDFACPGWARSRTSYGRHYVDAKTQAAKNRIAMEWQSGSESRPMFRSEISVQIHAIYKAPKSWPKKRAREAIGKFKPTKPDADNIAKLVLDALNGLAYPDDKDVGEFIVRKSYGTTNKLLIRVAGYEG